MVRYNKRIKQFWAVVTEYKCLKDPAQTKLLYFDVDLC